MSTLLGDSASHYMLTHISVLYLWDYSYSDNITKPYHCMLRLWHMFQEVWGPVATAGAISASRIHVETLLLLHRLWGPCSQLKWLSEIVNFENEADMLELGLGCRTKQIGECSLL
jgi:hypothetical protein